MDQKDDELTRFISVLQNDCDGQGKTNEKLSCKVGKLSNALEQMALERKKDDKAFDVEKRHGEELKACILKSEKIIEATVKELEKVKIERESIVIEDDETRRLMTGTATKSCQEKLVELQRSKVKKNRSRKLKSDGSDSDSKAKLKRKCDSVSILGISEWETDYEAIRRTV